MSQNWIFEFFYLCKIEQKVS